MRDAHRVPGKRNVFAFAVYSQGGEGCTDYPSSERCLGGRAAQQLNHHECQKRKEVFSLEHISEECPVCGCLVVQSQRTEHVMLYE
jgi:hypothetical protein